MRSNKEKQILEYPINSTVPSLFSKLSTGEGLATWFADRVETDGNRFIFFLAQNPAGGSKNSQKR